LQAAAAAEMTIPTGSWWVPLASLADPALVEAAAAQALGSKDTLAATVGDKRLMLVLDNFEHLLDAVAGLAQTVGACPRMTVLVTSREPLHVTVSGRSQSTRCTSAKRWSYSSSAPHGALRLRRQR